MISQENQELPENVYFLLFGLLYLQSAARKPAFTSTKASGVGSGLPPQVMSFLSLLLFGAALAGGAASFFFLAPNKPRAVCKQKNAS